MCLRGFRIDGIRRHHSWDGEFDISSTPLEVISTVAEQKRYDRLCGTNRSQPIKSAPYSAVNVVRVNSACDGWAVMHADVVATPHVYTDDKWVGGGGSKRTHGRGACIIFKENKVIQ
jgi:hypothetical protein